MICSNTANATFGAFGDDGNTTATAGLGFSLLGQAESGTNLSATSEFKNTNDTSVDMILAPLAFLAVLQLS